MQYKVVNADCMKVLALLPNDSVDVIFTDIPYDGVNDCVTGRTDKDNAIRKLSKGKADVITFPLMEFLSECVRVCKGTIIIFCGINQLSPIYQYLFKQKGTTRHLVWHKTNPSPMNGKHIYLSGVENAVWFKKRGRGVFNAHCKNTVFSHATGSSKIHPTEKNHKLIAEILQDNTTQDMLVFDPCMGSGSTGIVCSKLGLRFLGVELDKHFYDVAKQRVEEAYGGCNT